MTWADEWSRNWRDDLGGLLDLGATWQFGGGNGNGSGQYTSDVPPPQVVIEGSPRWCIPVTARRVDLSPAAESMLMEMRVRQDTGDISRLDLWVKAEWHLSECINPADALLAWSESVRVGTFAEQYPAQTTVTISETCSADETTYEYVRTTERRWNGVSYYRSSPVELVGSGGHPLPALYAAWNRLPSTSIAVASPTVLGGGGGPNLATRDERAFWSPIGSGGRFAATRSARRYTAALVPVPVLVPGEAYEALHTEEGLQASVNLASYSQFGLCWFRTLNLQVAGVVPTERFARELVLFGIRPDDTVDSITPLSRHDGVGLAGGSTHYSALFYTNVLMPVPENWYGIAIYEDIDCVAWLVDSRAGASADPMPCVIVTDLNLTQVRHVIPASALVPTDTFEADQTYDGATWAYAGEARYRYHNQDPECKGWVRSYTDADGSHTQHVLAIGLQYYDRV